MNSVLRLVLVIFLVLLLIGLLPAWPYSSGWGYIPSGTVALLVVVVVLLAVLNNTPKGRLPPV